MADQVFTPFSVGVYRCTQRLSAGRSGELFTAYHRPTGEVRVLRRVSPEVLADKTLADVVLQNLERIRQLNHPNVLRLYEIINDGQDVYAVLDHVDGIDLLTLLKQIRDKQPLSPLLASFITSQICQALDHAHHFREEGQPSPLVHGAVWPPNVLISYRGDVQVSDFGAWVIPTGMHGDEGGVSIRTQFSYRSPEHVNGSTLTSASDIFCIGILLYELVTGRQLFLGQSLMETLEMVENATIETLDPLPPTLRPVLQRALEREPSHRYADPASLFSELAVAVPRSGSREVRRELVQLLETFPRTAARVPRLSPEPSLRPSTTRTDDADEDEGATRRSNQPPVPPPDSLAPEPVAALTPLSGLREDFDEPTNINPTGVTEALVALSKDTTDPGSLDQFFPAEEEDEPTQIDPIIPGITGPDPLPALGQGRDADREEGPTNIVVPVDQQVLWASPDDDTASEEETDTGDEPTPVVYPSISPRVSDRYIGPAPSADDDASTVRTPVISGSLSGEFSSDDEPTIQASHQALESITPPPVTPPRRDPDEDPTFPAQSETPTPILGVSDHDDEPTRQASQPLTPKPPAGASGGSLPWPALENAYPAVAAPPQGRPHAIPDENGVTPGVDALARTALAPGSEDAGKLEFFSTGEESSKPDRRAQPETINPDDPEMVSNVTTFDQELQEVSEVSEISEVSGGSSYDPDSFVSGVSSLDDELSMMGPPRTRFTAAHMLLMVAIVVFLVAVGLLIRRLVMQSQARQPQANVQQVPDATVLTPTATALEPDARAKTKKTPPATKGKPAPVHSSGQHLNTLLHGKLKPGMLRVKTTPPGMVYINGKRVGTAPVTAKVRAGDQIKLLVEVPRYELHRQTVDVPLSRGMALEITLRGAGYKRADGKRKGWLTIHCRKRDQRRILLNGNDTGYSCPGPVVFRLKPGRYKLGFASLVTGKTRSRRARVRRGRKSHVWAPRGR